MFPLRGLDLSPYLSTDRPIPAALVKSARTPVSPVHTPAQAPIISPKMQGLRNSAPDIMMTASADFSISCNESSNEEKNNGNNCNNRNDMNIGENVNMNYNDDGSGNGDGVRPMGSDHISNQSSEIDANYGRKNNGNIADIANDNVNNDANINSDNENNINNINSNNSDNNDTMNNEKNIEKNNGKNTDSPIESSFESDLFPPIYDLVGVSNHCGTLNGGHYIAHVDTNAGAKSYREHQKQQINRQDRQGSRNGNGSNGNYDDYSQEKYDDNNQNRLNTSAQGITEQCGNDDSRWMCFNDEHVSTASTANIIGPSAYVLFYRLRES